MDNAFFPARLRVPHTEPGKEHARWQVRMGLAGELSPATLGMRHAHISYCKPLNRSAHGRVRTHV